MLITVWGENRVERTDPAVARDLSRRDARDDRLRDPRAPRRAHGGHGPRRSTNPGHGLDGRGSIETTDVLAWWGHLFHEDVADDVDGGSPANVCSTGWVSWSCTPATCRRAVQAPDGDELQPPVAGGRRPRARLDGRTRRIPLARACPTGVRNRDARRCTAEFFDIPPPDELVFISSFTGGEVFRSGCCFLRGKGQNLLLQPGPRRLPGLPPRPHVRRVIANAVLLGSRRPRAGTAARPGRRSRRAGWFER